ncbi:MAG: acetoin utilization protein AcuC [Nitrososphaeraceae archaeon]
MCRTAVFFGEELARYGFGRSHPFNSNRLYAFWSKFNELNFQKSNQIKIELPEIAKAETISQFHDKTYLEFVRDASKLGTGLLDRGDTPAFIGAFEASSYVVGTSLKGMNLIVERKDGILHAFNPIGGLHHARRGYAGGFCIFNDIGVMIIVARKKYGINRILYVDIDAHHGDGVYYEFENDPLLFVADIHEDGHYLYPGTGFEYETGVGDAKNTKLNLPLRPGATDNDFIAAFKEIEAFVENIAKPELIILQCGADGISGDPITHLQYSSKAHRYAADSLHRLSHEYCNGRIIALGGGGYNLKNIADAWTEVVGSLIETPK